MKPIFSALLLLLFSCNNTPNVDGEYYAAHNTNHILVIYNMNKYVYMIDGEVMNTGEYIQSSSSEITFKKWKYFNHCNFFDGKDRGSTRLSVPFDGDRIRMHYDLPECDFIKKQNKN